jgi:CubicO group peptidase (beta-lactamase class C family)
MRHSIGLCLLTGFLAIQSGVLRADGAATFTQADVASIRKQMHALVDEKHAAPGIVTLIFQGGKTVDADAYGLADVEKGTPMRVDSVMSIASMTKPVTGVAMMMLLDQGKWQLEDPIAKFIPEFRDLKVMDAGGKLVAPNHPPTMRELMSHTAGFTYGFFGDSAVDKLYVQANLLDPGSSLKAFIEKLARIPLKNQPGTTFEYSVSVDVQGYIVEKLSGMPYDVFVRDRILKPLKMNDTDFAVLGDARNRIAFGHNRDKSGKWAIALPPGGRDDVAKRVPGLPMPGGGLYSSAADYARFCQMVLNGGELDGVRLVKAETLKRMHQNLLTPGMRVAVGPTELPGTGFGLDFAVVENGMARGDPAPEGTFHWLGIYGTYFWIDPVNELFVIGMIQRDWTPVGGDPTYDPMFVRDQASKIVYAALED